MDFAWIHSYEKLAVAIRSFRNNREELIDILAFSLEECTLQFPLVVSGETLDDLDPFTFFAALNRDIFPLRRVRLLECLAEEFAVDLMLDNMIRVGNCHRENVLASSQPEQLFAGLFVLSSTDLCFFSRDSERKSKEIEALWDVFETALDYAETHTANNRKNLVAALEAASSLRVAGRRSLFTALSWISPRTYLPCSNKINMVLSRLINECDGVIENMEAEKYLTLHETILAITEPDFSHVFTFSEESRLFSITLAAWLINRPVPAAIDITITNVLIEKYIRASLNENVRTDVFSANVDSIDMPESKLDGKDNSVFKVALARYLSLSCFQTNWDLKAVDFCDMLLRSLEQYAALVFQSYHFNPYKEIVVFARNEPEIVRDAFVTLFDETKVLIERILRFERVTAKLFEQYRSEIVRAMPRRSSHGNLYAICAYLFLRYPDKYYLFSPNRANALRTATGFNRFIRVGEHDAVEQYFELCELVRSQALQHEQLLCAHEAFFDKIIEIVSEKGYQVYKDDKKHVLVECLAVFASEN